ncbi:hypothetical protein LC613_34140 [Nostoc sphaeroides CHAB 2801]|uniref:hypothetical protein n=1 Tax=Nostoc sphaeroides TaxID=446679 RepID=UPI001E349085|nr:hypothetical protein [Nostoc sphaeroides]MCC5632643.1 hypothetical protein [Nostoc sphaeroides CHAB 2801]
MVTLLPKRDLKLCAVLLYRSCKQCEQPTQRETFGVRPLYCEKCRPPQPPKQSKVVPIGKRKPRAMNYKSGKDIAG